MGPPLGSILAQTKLKAFQSDLETHTKRWTVEPNAVEGGILPQEAKVKKIFVKAWDEFYFKVDITPLPLGVGQWCRIVCFFWGKDGFVTWTSRKVEWAEEIHRWAEKGEGRKRQELVRDKNITVTISTSFAWSPLLACHQAVTMREAEHEVKKVQFWGWTQHEVGL